MDDNIVTVSVPVTSGDDFAGVMAADVRVATLEERAAVALAAQADGVCVLLNAESRVLLSNSADHIAGDVLPGDAALTLTEAGCFGWPDRTSRLIRGH